MRELFKKIIADEDFFFFKGIDSGKKKKKNRTIFANDTN